jgi:hypothetical protein
MRLIIVSLCFLMTSLSLFVGCKEEEVPESLSVPRLMIEGRGVNYGGMGGDLITLPVSGSSISVESEPVVNEFEIVNVEMIKVDLGIAMLVQVSGQGGRDLYRASVENMGSRIVLTVNGNGIGSRRIDGAIKDGKFYTFVEVDEEELGELVLDIKETIAYLQAKAAE